MMTQEQIDAFLAANADENGEVSDEMLMKAMSGDFEIEGDKEETPPDLPAETPTETDDEVKAENNDDENQVEEPTEENETPVLLAKDGKHTIPYERLEAATNEAKEANEKLAELQAELEALKAGKVEPEQDKAEEQPAKFYSEEDLEAIAEDFPELAAGIRKQQEALEALNADVKALKDYTTKTQADIAAQQAWEEHYKAITDAHKEYPALVNSGELKAWVDTQPAFVQRAYNEGTTQDVIELVGLYKAAKPAPKSTPKPDVSKVVDEAVKKAEAKSTVSSLSDIPGARTQEVDEVAAMANMSPMALAAKLEGKTPQQVMEFLDRFV